MEKSSVYQRIPPLFPIIEFHSSSMLDSLRNTIIYSLGTGWILELI